MVIPFIMVRNKKHRCFEGGDSACPPRPPLHCTIARNNFLRSYGIRGLKRQGVKPP
jgi:hypothetical protein